VTVSTALDRRFFERDCRDVAPDLLNKVLVHGKTRGRIVEVEAYCGAIDPAAHTYRGRTDRNAAMFGPPGRLYVYFSYGMHWCANVVCEPEGIGTAVLIRALAPIRGIASMERRRPKAERPTDLCSGPAKLCQALAIDGAHDGVDLLEPCGIAIVDDGVPPPASPARTTRVGITKGVEHRWRWYVPDDPNVSRPR
jgi:DNA-3-methyladenine glycosylase